MIDARHYCDQIAALGADAVTLEVAKHDDLRLFRDAQLEIYYAPFEYINREAKVAVVGVTPGPTQLLESHRVIRDQYSRDTPLDQALAAVKAAASFKGMRADLGRWLDEVGTAELLGVRSCDVLFDDSHRHLLHTTSAIRYPTFSIKRDGTLGNYNGSSPALLDHPRLATMIGETLAAELAQMGEALIVPLGKGQRSYSAPL